jgi:hypothetical protein
VRKTEQCGPGGSGGRDAEIPLVREFLSALPDTAVVCDCGGVENGVPTIQDYYSNGHRFARVDVVDIRPVNPEAIRWRNLNFKHANMVDPGFAQNGSYDAITCVSVLEHTHCNVYGAAGGPGYDKVILDHILCKLAPRGRALVTVPANTDPADPVWWCHCYGMGEVRMLTRVAATIIAGAWVRWLCVDGNWQWYEMDDVEFAERARVHVAGVGAIAAITYERRAD